MEYDYRDSVDISEIKRNLEIEKDSFLNNSEQVINNINVYSIT
jgi:hypothetical protein